MIRKILTLLFVVAVSILITACGNNESSENIISVVGSSSVAPLIEAVSENYLRVKNIEIKDLKTILF